MNGPPEHRTVQTIALVGIVLASGRDVSPAAVALIATVTGLAGTSIGSLASMLVSTHQSAAPGDPTTVTAPADATVRVEPAEPGPTPEPAPAPRKTARKSTGRRRHNHAEPR